MKNAVVYVSDFNDRRFLFQSIASLRFFDKSIPVFVAADSTDVGLGNARLLEKHNARLVKVSPDIRSRVSALKLDPKMKWGKNVFYRLFIPCMEQFKEFDRILYVDTDTIFFKDFNFLFGLESSHFYGMFYQKSHSRPYETQKHLRSLLDNAYTYAQRNCRGLELRCPFPYCNGGAVVFNNRAIQESAERWNAALDEFLRVFDCSVFPQYDQMFLNIFFEFDEYSSSEWDVNTPAFSKKTVIGHFYGINPALRRRRLLAMKASLSVHNPQLFKAIRDSSMQ